MPSFGGSDNVDAAGGRATFMHFEESTEVTTGADTVDAAAGRATFINAEMDTEVTTGATKLEAVVGRATVHELEKNTQINAGASTHAVAGKIKPKTKEFNSELVYEATI